MGKYLKLFETDSARAEYEDSENYLEPYVSYVEGDNTVHYNKPKFFCKLTLNDDSEVIIEGSGVLTSTMIKPYSSQGIKSTEIGELCTGIGANAFRNISSIVGITIPNSVKSIAGYAFSGCEGLTTVTIGSGVTEIGSYTFYTCTNLSSVTIKAVTPPTLFRGVTVFASNANNRKIYVPSESVDVYKAASGWSTYATDIEPIQ